MSAPLPVPLSLPELLTLPEPEHRFAVEGIIPHPAITLIAGPPDSLKTWVALEIGFSMANATRFLETFPAPEPHKILFVQLEMGGGEMAHRVRLLGAGDFPGHIAFLVDQPFDLYNPADFHWLTQQEEDILILDSAVRLFRGRENEAQDVARFFALLLALKQAGMSVVLLHHLRKPAADAGPVDLAALVRGSGDFLAAPDAAFVLRRLDAHAVTISCVKMRNAPKSEDFVIRLVGDGSRLSLVYEPAEVSVPDAPPLRSAVLERIKGGDSKTGDVVKALRGRFPERMIRATVRSLLQEGQVVEDRAFGRRVLTMPDLRAQGTDGKIAAHGGEE